MYVWKLWRDSRARVLVSLLFGAIWISGIAYGEVMRSAVPFNKSPQVLQGVWSEVAKWGVGVTALMALLATLFLGGVTVGDEFDRRTAEFLLTRPRRRRTIVWTGYLIGVGELALMMLFTTLCAIGVLLYFSGTVLSWRLTSSCILLLPMVSIVYGIAYLSSVITNSGRRGSAIALLVVVLYIGALSVFQFYTHVRRPDWWFDTLDEWVTHPQASFPLIALIGWTIFSMFLPLAAQLTLERKEV